MNNKLVHIFNFLNTNRYIKSIKDAFSLIFPFTLVSSILLSLAFLLKDFLSDDLFDFLINFISPSIFFSSGILSIFLAIGVGYSLSNNYKINALNGAMVAVFSFLIQIPIENANYSQNFIEINFLGYKSIFSSIIISIISVEIYHFFSEKILKFNEKSPSPILQSITNFIPLLITIFFALFVRFLCSITDYENFTNLIFPFFQSPLTKILTSFFATIFIGIICNLFWYFGIHGQAMVYSFMMIFWSSLNAENILNLLVSNSPPNLVSSSFIGANITLGGWISVPFLIALYIYNKENFYNKIEKTTLISGVFNIYEPLMFGFPVVFNKNFLIPLILTPIITTTVIYKSMELGFIPFANGVQLPLTTPLVLVGFLTTNSIKGGLIQLILIPFLTIMWLFFIKKDNLNKNKSEKDISNE